MLKGEKNCDDENGQGKSGGTRPRKEGGEIRFRQPRFLKKNKKTFKMGVEKVRYYLHWGKQ